MAIIGPLLQTIKHDIKVCMSCQSPGPPRTSNYLMVVFDWHVGSAYFITVKGFRPGLPIDVVLVMNNVFMLQRND